MVRSWKSRTITMNLHTAFVCSVNARRKRNNSLCKWTEHRRNELFARRKTRSIFHINFECVQWIKHQNIAHSLHITQCLSLVFFLCHSHSIDPKDDVAQCAQEKWTKTYILYRRSSTHTEIEFTPIGFLFVYQFDLLLFCSYFDVCIWVLWLTLTLCCVLICSSSYFCSLSRRVHNCCCDWRFHSLIIWEIADGEMVFGWL